MEQIYWAWADDDGVYINKAESFTEIIMEVIEYYLEDCDKVDAELEEGMIKVQLTQGSIQQNYFLESDRLKVSEFLNEMSIKYGRDDMFCIRRDI